MTHARAQFAAVCCNEKIYVFSGWNEHLSMTECECFDPCTQKWVDIAPMPVGRSDIRALLMSDKNTIAIMGGHCILVHLYNVRENVWTTASWSLRIHRHNFSAHYLENDGGQVIICGGVHVGSRFQRVLKRCDMYTMATNK